MVWYIRTMEYYSVIKQNKIIPFTATWMELEIIIPSEVSQKEKDKCCMIWFTCGILTQMNLSTKQEQIHRHREQTCCQGGGRWGRDG